jgi:hypothetical protein
VLTLALGIGANTTIFSVLNAVWLRPLPYPEADQLTLVWRRNTKRGDDSYLASGNYHDLLRQNQSFAQMAVISDHDFSLTGRGEPERLQGQSVSASFFRLLKVAPSLGRDFTEADDRIGVARVVILSHGLWQRRFGGKADVIGQTLTLNELSYTVVGVMPPGFVVPEGNAELWTPIAFSVEAANDRGSFYLSALARLKPGVTLATAQSEADVIAHNLEQAYPQSNTDLGFSIVSLHGFIVRGFNQSLWVLLGAGLVLRGLQRAQQINPGFNPRQAVEVSFDPGLQGYDSERGREFQRQALDRVRGLPGVQAAALTTRAPLTFGQDGRPVFIQGEAPKPVTQAPYALTTAISLDYFRAMETRLLQGRDFTAQDDARSPAVAIVNETFARRFWPGENPIGKRFNFTGASDGKWIEIVGVAQDGKYFSLAENSESFVYLPLAQGYERAVTLIARGAGDPNLLTAAIRNEMRGLDANLPLYNARTMVEHMELPRFPARVAATALGAFGPLALLLAAVGVFGVMSYAVTQRTREIGVRIALGAGSNEILKLIVGHGAMLAGTGVGIGLGVAGLGTRLLANLLFGVSAIDPLTFVSVTALLTATAFLACYLPARRATKVDPMVALRQD